MEFVFKTFKDWLFSEDHVRISKNPKARHAHYVITICIYEHVHISSFILQ